MRGCGETSPPLPTGCQLSYLLVHPFARSLPVGFSVALEAEQAGFLVNLFQRPEHDEPSFFTELLVLLTGPYGTFLGSPCGYFKMSASLFPLVLQGKKASSYRIVRE